MGGLRFKPIQQPQLGRPGIEIATKKLSSRDPGRRNGKPREANYLFWPSVFLLSSFFLGLHFSQTLPSFLAVMQHLWGQGLPSALAFSQQFFSAANAGTASNTVTQRAAINVLMNFINLGFSN
jgi:hypothetical protein